MIVIASSARQKPAAHWHAQFLAMVPAITRRARISFCNLRTEAREEMVQEVVGICLVAFHRLVVAGKANVAYSSVLARHAIAQVRHGRRVGGRLNIDDVSSRYAQRRRGIELERLDERDLHTGTWKLIVLEDHRATPADTAVCRIDFQEWLGRLPAKQQRIVRLLAIGEQVSVVAKRVRLTPGRVSQLRRKLQVSWDAFQFQANCQPA